MCPDPIFEGILRPIGKVAVNNDFSKWVGIGYTAVMGQYVLRKQEANGKKTNGFDECLCHRIGEFTCFNGIWWVNYQFGNTIE